MAYETPTQEELLALFVAGINTFLQECDVSEGSPEWHLGNTVAQMAEASMGHAKALARDVNPLYAQETDLDALANLYGIPRTPARGAADGEIRVSVSGTGSWLATLQFTSSDGLLYQVDTAGTWAATDSFKDIPFSAVDTGAATTKPVGTFMTVLSPPGGMGALGEVQTAFATVGLDQETDEELRARLLNLLAGTGNSGNRGDYVRWMEEVEGVAEGFVYQAIRHILSVDGTIFGPASSPGNRWVTSTTLDDVNDYINGTTTTEGQRAVGQDFLAVLPEAENQAVDLTITPDNNYGRDWGTSSPAASLAVSGVTGPPFNTIVVTVNPSTEGLVVGDRVAINVRTASSATHYTLEVRTVTGIASAGANWNLTLDEPLTFGTVLSPLYPAGPTTAATVTAIESIFDALGPSDDASGSRWPKVTSEKPSDLVLAELNRAVMDVEVDGVRRHLNTSWTTPASDVTPTQSALVSGAFKAYTIRLTTTRIRYDKINT